MKNTILAFIKKVLLGLKIMDYLNKKSNEYNRKAKMLLALNTIALILLSSFTIVSYLRGEIIPALTNLCTLFILILGYIHIRVTGKLFLDSVIISVMFMAQFLIDFNTTEYRAMWSYTVPMFIILLFGIKKGLYILFAYFGLTIASILYINPDIYNFDFKIRFPVIFFTITYMLIISEKNRVSTLLRLKKTEVELTHARKMESIGQLAGGIAHDFNNQLAGITGFAELIKLKSPKDGNVIKYVNKILLTAKRSATTTNQLLAFARKGKYVVTSFNIHDILKEVISILNLSINKNIIVEDNFLSKYSTIKGDSSQIQNTLLNIAINSRDSLQDGGLIHFSTKYLNIQKEHVEKYNSNIITGKYIEINITDTGSGIDPKILNLIFEPFFTTKDHGKGTGLGLAAVYGVIKNHYGYINVKSKLQGGTTFSILLPLNLETETLNDSSLNIKIEKKKFKKSNILFVDDEKVIREIATEIISGFGHSITTKEDGEVALEYYKNNWRSIDLVILDMIMPKMGGRETFKAMQKINPNIKSILSSGYSLKGEAQEILDEGVLLFLQKPFQFKEIETAISSIVS